MRALNESAGGPLRRFGGKGQTAPLLIPHFARAPIYVEPFFGGGGVFFQLPVGIWRTFILNDLDGEVVNFFRVLRNQSEELIAKIRLTPFSREEYKSAYEKTDEPIERARRMWVRSRQSFGGIDKPGNGWATASGPSRVASSMHASTETKIGMLSSFAETLRASAMFENVDAVELVKLKGQDGAFLYCDPPYVADARNGDAYSFEMTDAQHRTLAKELHAAVERGAKVALSGYNTLLYEELYGAWRRVEHEVHLKARLDGAALDKSRTECLWLSYPEEDEIGAKPAISVPLPKGKLEMALLKQAHKAQGKNAK